MDQPLAKPALQIRRIMQLETYLAAIGNSVGSTQFRNLIVEMSDGSKRDIAGDGLRSCALCVSWTLKIFDLVKEPHATVEGLMLDLESSGWRVSALCLYPGQIIVWEQQCQPGSGEAHRHAGFYIGDGFAISHSDIERVPKKHPAQFHNQYGVVTRKIEATYTHPFLEGLV